MNVEIKETHADQALQLVGAISALSHDIKRALDTQAAGLPSGATMKASTISVEGVEPEVVDLAYVDQAIQAWRPKWGSATTRGMIVRSAVCQIEGLLVHLTSKPVEGRITTEAIRPDGEKS